MNRVCDGQLLDFSDSFVISCGTVTFDLSRKLILLIHNTANAAILLPKGRKDVSEGLEEAAIRETREESGYQVQLLSHPNKTRATGMRSVTNHEPIAVQQRIVNGIRKLIFWYLAFADSTAPQVLGEREAWEEEYEAIWRPVANAPALMTFKEDRQLLERGISIVEKLPNPSDHPPSVSPSDKLATNTEPATHKDLIRQKVYPELVKVAFPDSRFHFDFSSYITDFEGSDKAIDRLLAHRTWQGKCDHLFNSNAHPMVRKGSTLELHQPTTIFTSVPSLPLTRPFASLQDHLHNPRQLPPPTPPRRPPRQQNRPHHHLWHPARLLPTLALPHLVPLQSRTRFLPRQHGRRLRRPPRPPQLPTRDRPSRDRHGGHKPLRDPLRQGTRVLRPRVGHPLHPQPRALKHALRSTRARLPGPGRGARARGVGHGVRRGRDAGEDAGGGRSEEADVRDLVGAPATGDAGGDTATEGAEGLAETRRLRFDTGGGRGDGKALAVMNLDAGRES